MTVETTVSRAGPYAGAGTVGPFPVPFRFLENAHLRLIKTLPDGTNSDLVLDVDYSVAGAGDDTGSVTLAAPLFAQYKLTILRNVPATQEADYVQNDSFPAQSHETALDKLTMLVQQNDEILRRAIKLPVSVDGVSTTLPVPSPNKLVGWDSNGTGLANYNQADLVTSIAYGTARGDLFSGDGVTTVFSLTSSPGALNNLDVAIGGVTQRPGIDYTWTSGTNVTFTTAPVAGTSNIFIRYMQALALGFSSANSVSVAAILGVSGSTAQDAFADIGAALNVFALADYAALRAYVGTRKNVIVTGYLVTAKATGIYGEFVRDPSDATSVDNGGTIIVSADGTRWKRSFTGATQVDWFGADPTGATSSHSQINAAMASITTFGGTVEFSRGNYLIGGVLTTAISGTTLRGQSWLGTYFTTPAASTHDILRIEHSYCGCFGIQFRPGSVSNISIRVYAAHATIDGNRFLAFANNSGTAIFATDVHPVTAAFVPGAYTHSIVNNVIGVAGFAFATAIDLSSTSGMQACKLLNNQILSDRCILMPRGGGNTYTGNLLQTYTAAGVGIDLGANANAEMIAHNYFEGFLHGIMLRNLSNANQVANAINNHYDGCTNKLTSLGTTNYVYENNGGALYMNGWTNNFSSATRWRFLTPSGGEGFNVSSTGIFQVGTTSGTSHTINTVGAAEGAVIFTMQGAGNSSQFSRYANGTAANAANCAQSLKANSVTGRSVNAGGTINASGADYAEYLIKSLLCGSLVRGQIVGIDVNGELTDKWGEAIAFMVKSTNPSIVGGDTWDTVPQPDAPAEDAGADEWDAYALATDEWQEQHETKRARVDRMAFCGQVPVNVYGAAPGDYIVPVQDGDGIKGIAVKAPTFEQYMIAVGRVVTIEEDGRARIIVKVS